MNIINKLHDSFLEEATKSPFLLEDLSNMEKYISESYSNRSLIELIQNSDDAQSTEFLISILDSDSILIANNGNYFSDRDVEALCRSGSSTKKRKSNSIGFRGIGFKSIVNYTKTVHLVSGDIKLTFSKELTEKEIGNKINVPLVRIPHEFNGNKYDDEIKNVIDKGYTTIFIFEVKTQSLIDEIKSFDESYLLFLKNIKSVKFKTNDKLIEYSSNYEILDQYNLITIKSKESKTQYFVLSKQFNGQNIDIAFLFEDDTIKPLDNKNSVIHSFMPTTDSFCIPCKVNGDFSTDPSRTKIVMDEESINVTKGLAEYFSEILWEIIFNSKEDKYNIISIISSINLDPLRIYKTKDVNVYFSDYFEEFVKKFFNSKNIIIKPKWLNEKSFNDLYKKSGKFLIGDETERNFFGIKKLCKILGQKELDNQIILKEAKKKILSKSSRIELIVEIIKKNRFTLTPNDKQNIADAYLFEVNGNPKRLSEMNNESVDDEFINEILEKLYDKNDLKWFVKKIGFDNHFNIKELSETKHTENNYPNSDIITNPKIVRFNKKPNLTKWRSVELNVIECIRFQENINNVKDVSHMNVGYDAEAIDNTGNKIFYEIKSVNSLGDPFKITNNEYSTANYYKNNYCLAIACQHDNFIEICFIYNPIEKLKLNKRIVQWEWVCNQYEGEYSKLQFII